MKWQLERLMIADKQWASHKLFNMKKSSCHAQHIDL